MDRRNVSLEKLVGEGFCISRNQDGRQRSSGTLGCVGTIIAFRVGATDAAILERQFGADVPSARDLVGLANFDIYLKLMVDDVQTKPFSARTLPPEMHIAHAL